MHPLDRLAQIAFRYSPLRQRVFTAGWGDEAARRLLVVPEELSPPASLAINWVDRAAGDGITVADGTFVSPNGDLPLGSEVGVVRLVMPIGGTDRLVVQMAAWNDHGYRTRDRLARMLAERGVGSAILENPYFGRRRPWNDHVIRTVADFAVMGRAAVDEGRALLAHFGSEYRVGVTGFSMGGNIAALIGATMDRKVAIAALAASHSPAPVWLDGLAGELIDWRALGGRDQAGRLREELGKATVLAVPPRAHTSHSVILGATGDGYIPQTATEALHRHWPGSELRWFPGGHATLMWRRKTDLVDAIEDSFERAYGS